MPDNDCIIINRVVHTYIHSRAKLSSQERSQGTDPRVALGAVKYGLRIQSFKIYNIPIRLLIIRLIPGPGARRDQRPHKHTYAITGISQSDSQRPAPSGQRPAEQTNTVYTRATVTMFGGARGSRAYAWFKCTFHCTILNPGYGSLYPRPRVHTLVP